MLPYIYIYRYRYMCCVFSSLSIATVDRNSLCEFAVYNVDSAGSVCFGWTSAITAEGVVVVVAAVIVVAAVCLLVVLIK